MKVNGQHYRTIFPSRKGGVEIIDQTLLPFEFKIICLNSCQQVIDSIRSMQVRGAPLIGAAAAYGMAFAMQEDSGDENLKQAATALIAARPTAINLKWAVERVKKELSFLTPHMRVEAALSIAGRICEEDVKVNKSIGAHGLKLLEEISARKYGQAVNVLTHCNAGWLGTVDYGTALSPIFMAKDAGMDIHVWVDETRPRNQGALTAWELAQHGVSHTYIVDNAGGHIMQHRMVDIVVVGTDRTTARGDVCNKIGTYLKALAAKDNDVPFYAAVPSSSIDWDIDDGVRQIPIEERGGKEITQIYGYTELGISSVTVTPPATRVVNYGFDVTPASLLSGYITEYGVFKQIAMVRDSRD